MTTYRTCAVPMCSNTTTKYPDKLYVHVPKRLERRKQWLKLACRDPKVTSDKSPIFFCEDHFDLPNDMENYLRYSLMGSVGKIRMKPDCLPSKFKCQLDSTKRTAPPQPGAAASKRRHKDKVHDVASETKMLATSGMTSNSVSQSATKRDHGFSGCQDQATPLYPEATNILVPVCLTEKIRSKAVQTTSQLKDKNTSPLKTNIKSTVTSDFKITKFRVYSATLESTTIEKKLLLNSEKLEMPSSSSSPSKHSQLNTDTLPSLQSLHNNTLTSSTQEAQSELAEIKREIETEDLCRMSVENTVRFIKNNPGYYIGISKDCYYLIELIQKHTEIPEEHILLCLKKIRLNTPFSELGDQFGMSLSHAREIFMKSIPLIGSKLHPFIIQLNKRAVKRNLPMTFRHKYNNIYCIIECLEVEIEKPSESVEHDLTWSEYKKANTAKYLISSTPNGIIHYISPGYSGGDTDDLLVQDCNFLDSLEPGVSLLADRGFKHMEGLLLQKGISLVRPPNVASKAKLSEQDIIKPKQITSLRIHIERVITHFQEFTMLKPHSVVNKELFQYLDYCVVIACALSNLQNGIIKNM